VPIRAESPPFVRNGAHSCRIDAIREERRIRAESVGRNTPLWHADGGVLRPLDCGSG